MSNEDSGNKPPLTTLNVNTNFDPTQLAKALKQITESAAEAQKRLNDEYSVTEKKLSSINDALNGNKKLMEDGIETQYSSSELRIKEFEQIMEQVRLKKQLLKIDFDKIYAQEKLNGASEEYLATLERSYQVQQEELDTIIEQNQGHVHRNKLAVDFGKSQSSAFSSITGIGVQSNTVLGRMIQLKGEGISYSHSLKEATEQIMKSLTPANLLAAAVDKIGQAIKGVINLTKEFALEQDKAYANFEKEAGNVSKYKDEISKLRLENGRYSLSISEATKEYGAFKKEFAGFSSMSEEQRLKLGETSAQLGKLGVAQQDVIKTQELMVKGFGMTVEQSTDLQKSLYGTAKAMELPPGKVAAEFAKAAPQLAKHGKDMTKVFIDLQNNAKNTGIAFDRLLSITEKFDTFEGAADAAGQLNAILGGDYLNSIDLLNASEGERVRIMQESLKAANKSYDDMSVQERKAAAAALGLQDVTDLQKLLNNQTEMGTVEAMRAEEAQKEMNKAIEDATELGEAWKSLLMKLAVEMRPIIEAVKSVIMAINGFLDEYPAFATALGYIVVIGGTLASILIAVAMAFIFIGTTITSAQTVLGTGTKALEKGGKKAGSAMNSMAQGVSNVGRAAEKSKGGILALGGAFLMIGTGILLATVGLAQLISAFAGLSGEQVVGAFLTVTAVMIAFTVMLGILAKVSAVSAIPLLAVGAAFMMIGAGIAIAALGMSVLVKSFAGLGENAMPAALAVGLLAGSMVLITYAMVGAIPATVAAGVAFKVAAPGILAFGAAVALIGVGIGAAAAGIGFMTKGVSELFNALSKADPANIKKSFDTLFDSLSVTGVAKFSGFATAANNLAESLEDINSNLSEMILKMAALNAFGFAPKINTPSATQTATPVANTISTTTAAAAATSNAVAGGAGGGNTNIVPVAVYLDSKKVGEILDPKIKQTIQDSLKNVGSKTAAVGI